MLYILYGALVVLIPARFAAAKDHEEERAAVEAGGNRDWFVGAASLCLLISFILPPITFPLWLDFCLVFHASLLADISSVLVEKLVRLN